MKYAYKLLDSFVEWWGNGTPAPKRKKRKYKKRKK